MAGTLENLASQGIEPEKPPYRVREGGSLIAFVRDPDGYRIELIERAANFGLRAERTRMDLHTDGARSPSSLAVIDCGSGSFRLVVFSYTDAVVEAHGRDPRVRARRRGARGDGRAPAGADGARVGDARALRALLQGRGDRRDPPGGDVGDPRRSQPAGVPEGRAQARRARDPGAGGSRGSALRLPRRDELDDLVAGRRARARRRLDAAHAGRGARGGRPALVAARWRPDDGALPVRRRQAQA